MDYEFVKDGVTYVAVEPVAQPLALVWIPKPDGEAFLERDGNVYQAVTPNDTYARDNDVCQECAFFGKSRVSVQDGGNCEPETRIDQRSIVWQHFGRLAAPHWTLANYITFVRGWRVPDEGINAQPGLMRLFVHLCRTTDKILFTSVTSITSSLVPIPQDKLYCAPPAAECRYAGQTLLVNPLWRPEELWDQPPAWTQALLDACYANRTALKVLPRTSAVHHALAWVYKQERLRGGHRTFDPAYHVFDFDVAVGCGKLGWAAEDIEGWELPVRFRAGFVPEGCEGLRVPQPPPPAFKDYPVTQTVGAYSTYDVGKGTRRVMDATGAQDYIGVVDKHGKLHVTWEQMIAALGPNPDGTMPVPAFIRFKV